ncbi:MAG: XdhC/CoxI family protein [Bacteroidetes bacterium]|nr:MAG: XdhC/CoxI family protein [Bacteroidota bacterium]
MEFSTIIEQAHQCYQNGKKAVMATIVHREGSSYRGEGTRMLLSEDGEMTFALSGGCIEMEVFNRAQSVFTDGVSKLITYDGLIRLGCQGLLYILLEPIVIDDTKHRQIQELIHQRKAFSLTSYYLQKNDATGNFGTILTTEEGLAISISGLPVSMDEAVLSMYEQEASAPFRLLLFGSGHDVTSFSTIAKSLGWEVIVVVCNQSPKTKADFPQADTTVRFEGDAMGSLRIDQRTAAVVMTHNYDKDYAYVKALLHEDPAYVGMIGSIKRRERLRNDLLQEGFVLADIDTIFTPAGLNLGAETPEEIAVSIIAEILAVSREKDPVSLKHIKGSRIHLAC